MSVEISITNEVTGVSKIYENKDRTGRCIEVPTYRLIIKNDTGYRDDYNVTRDTFKGIYGNTLELYGEYDECPPNMHDTPYEGYILEHNEKGFRIGIAEISLKDNCGGHSIKGVGVFIRKYIQIHIGPGCSEGCFLLTGGKGLRDLFEKSVRMMLKRAREPVIKVYVENRYI